MKINGDNKASEPATDKAPRRDKKEAKEKAFKKVLEGKDKDKKPGSKPGRAKQGGKADSADAPAKTGRGVQGDASTAGSAPGDAGQAGPMTEGRLVERRGEFGRELRDGRVQVEGDLEREARHDGRRDTSLRRGERRSDQRQLRQARGDIASERTIERKAEVRGSQKGGPGGIGSSKDVQAAPADGMSAPAEASEVAGSDRAEGAQSARGTELREQVAELANKLVDKAHIGRDTAGRQIMLLDLQVPGRGGVRVRLRRRGQGFEVRMRADNEELARDLRHEREHFRQSAADRGVQFSSVDVVG